MQISYDDSVSLFFFYYNGKPESEEKRFVLDSSSGSLRVGALRSITASLLVEFRGGARPQRQEMGSLCVRAYSCTLISRFLTKLIIHGDSTLLNITVITSQSSAHKCIVRLLHLFQTSQWKLKSNAGVRW